MLEFLWDASALVKHYAPEAGSDTVDALLAATSSGSMITTHLVYAETSAALRRTLNRGIINAPAFTAARSLLRLEFFVQPRFLLMPLDEEAFLGSVPLVDQHNLNASDAAILYAYLRCARMPRRRQHAAYSSLRTIASSAPAAGRV